MLFAEGFVNAKVLSKKMVKLYKLSSEQLSQQDHYDFGMRAVKSVLVMAGGLKRANPALDEDVVLIRAMRDANLPKFLVDDVQLFQAIIQDLFPGVKIPEQACHRRGPAPHPAALAHLTRFRLSDSTCDATRLLSRCGVQLQLQPRCVPQPVRKGVVLCLASEPQSWSTES
jgi:hypothetical protein